MKAVLLGALLLESTLAQAQQYPSRPIRLVTASTAGSGSDVVSRMIAPRLSELLGQQVVVDNRSGASGLVAAELVARAAPDGHTLWVVTLTQLISTTLQDRFHLAREYAPIGMLGGTPFVIVVNSGLNVKSIAELVAYARAKPRSLMYGTAGAGTSGHICMEMLEHMTGARMMHVPYKGTMQALTEVMGGQIQGICLAVPTLSLITGQQKARVLAATTRGPTVLAPGLPPVAESVPGFELNGWYGMLAPPGTPPAIIKRLHQEFSRVVMEPAVRERLLGVGMEPTPSAPAAFSEFLRAEVARIGVVLKSAGVKP
jgi:tripartite-type tricarboxylate transporter receptor subunit TctC